MRQRFQVVVLLGGLCWTLSCGGASPPPESNIARKVADSEGNTVVFLKVTTTTGSEQIASGIIVDPSGRILTAEHALEDVKEAWVKPRSGLWMPVTGIVATDELKDLAVLQAEPGKQVLQPARLGSVSTLSQGDPVVAIGNPLGQQNSISDGIVSAIRSDRGFSVIQTTAPVSPGNSGGPLLNSNGEVVGVISFSLNDAAAAGQNLNYAVAIDEALSLLGRIDVQTRIPVGVSPPANGGGGIAAWHLGWIPLAFALAACGILYLMTTYVLFPALIKDPGRHPSQAFGISAIVFWGLSFLILGAVVSGCLQRFMGLSSTCVHEPLWGGLILALVFGVVIWLLARPREA